MNVTFSEWKFKLKIYLGLDLYKSLVQKCPCYMPQSKSLLCVCGIGEILAVTWKEAEQAAAADYHKEASCAKAWRGVGESSVVLWPWSIW